MHRPPEVTVPHLLLPRVPRRAMHRACGPAHQLQLGHDARGVHERVVLGLGWVALGVWVRVAVVLAKATLTLLALLA